MVIAEARLSSNIMHFSVHSEVNMQISQMFQFMGKKKKNGVIFSPTCQSQLQCSLMPCNALRHLSEVMM